MSSIVNVDANAEVHMNPFSRASAQVDLGDAQDAEMSDIDMDIENDGEDCPPVCDRPDEASEDIIEIPAVLSFPAFARRLFLTRGVANSVMGEDDSTSIVAMRVQYNLLMS